MLPEYQNGLLIKGINLLIVVSHGMSRIDGFHLYTSKRLFQVVCMIVRGSRDTHTLLEE
jgi:hypothetical protein